MDDWEKKKQKHHRRKMKKAMQKIKKRKKWKKNKSYEPNDFSKHTNKDNLLRFMRKKKFFNDPPIFDKDKVVVKIPEVFSFSENPIETLKTLKDIVAIGNKNGVKEIHFDHFDCVNLGIGASLVMDTIVLAIKRSTNIDLSGKVPVDNMKIMNILQVTGILKRLGLGFSEKKEIERLELQKGKDAGEGATKVTEYLSRCLKTQNLTLTKRGNAIISEMVGEVIDNCSLHGGEFAKRNKEWYIIGHYSIEDGGYGECNLSILNYGDTIYQSLKTSTNDMIDLLKNMAKKHRNRFSLFKKKWRKETLWTLYALQEGISSCRDEFYTDRGHGTIKLIEKFQEIGSTNQGKKPIMSITSGNVNILFDEKYKVETIKLKEGERKVIAFNEDNDLEKEPNPEKVKSIKHFFPGTVISMKFYIDRGYITESLEE